MTGPTWPQGLLLAWLFFGLVYAAAHDGELRKEPNDRYRFGMTLIRAGLLIALMYWGNFFG